MENNETIEKKPSFIYIDIGPLADQLESSFSGQRVAVYLIPSGGVRDWYNHRHVFTHRGGKRRNVRFIERILRFAPYDVKHRRIGHVISTPEEVRARGSRSVLIYDDVIGGGHSISEAAYFLLMNSEELGFSSSFTLYTAGKIDYAGISNFSALPVYGKWLGLRRYLEIKAKRDKRINKIHSELKSTGRLGRIAEIQPFPSYKNLVLSQIRPLNLKYPQNFSTEPI